MFASKSPFWVIFLLLLTCVKSHGCFINCDFHDTVFKLNLVFCITFVYQKYMRMDVCSYIEILSHIVIFVSVPTPLQSVSVLYSALHALQTVSFSKPVPDFAFCPYGKALLLFLMVALFKRFSKHATRKVSGI